MSRADACKRAEIYVALLVVGFLGVLYVPYSTRYARDSEMGVKRRSVATAAMSCCGTFAVVVTRWQYFRENVLPLTFEALLHDLARALLAAAFGVGFSASLYLPSLVHIWLLTQLASTPRPPEERASVFNEFARAIFPLGGWIAARNYVIAPLTEELTFRWCAGHLMLSSGCSITRAICVPSLFFSLAHTHHLIRLLRIQREKYHRWREVPARVFVSAGTLTLLQVAYTALFGVCAGWLLMLSQSITAPIFAHVLCNALGLPDFTGIMNFARRNRFTATLFITSALLSPVCMYCTRLAFTYASHALR